MGPSAKYPESAPGRARTEAAGKRQVGRCNLGDGVVQERAGRGAGGANSSRDGAFSPAMYDYCLMPKYWDIL